MIFMIKVQELVGEFKNSLGRVIYSFWTYASNSGDVFSARKNAQHYHAPDWKEREMIGHAEIKPLLRGGKPSFIEVDPVFCE